MALERLQLENVRCIQAADLVFSARCNLIYGANASGKTSLLEAIYFLGRARSFRASKGETLIRTGADRLVTTGHMSRPHRQSVLGVGYGRAGRDGRLAGRAVAGVAELATIRPDPALDPDPHQLIED